MPVYPESDDHKPAIDLFGDRPAECGTRRARGRQQAAWRERCNRLDSFFLGGGKSLSSVRCPRCGGELQTSRSRSAKLRFYDAIMKRNVALVIAAAHGAGDVDVAVEYATYAAHTVFLLRLVAYGPEPVR